jgi:hypothetical protein
VSAQDDRSKARLGIAITKPTITRSVNVDGWKKELMYVSRMRTGNSVNIIDAISHARAVSSFRMRRRLAAASGFRLCVAAVGDAARLVAPYVPLVFCFWWPLLYWGVITFRPIKSHDEGADVSRYLLWGLKRMSSETCWAVLTCLWQT